MCGLILKILVYQLIGWSFSHFNSFELIQLLTYIADDLSPEINISMYADDTKIWRRITSQDDHWLLQRDINSLQNWARFNKMVFHPS